VSLGELVPPGDRDALSGDRDALSGVVTNYDVEHLSQWERRLDDQGGWYVGVEAICPLLCLIFGDRELPMVVCLSDLGREREVMR